MRTKEQEREGNGGGWISNLVGFFASSISIFVFSKKQSVALVFFVCFLFKERIQKASDSSGWSASLSPPAAFFFPPFFFLRLLLLLQNITFQ